MGTSLRILVADDDPEILFDIAETLEELGASVTRAASGDQLIAHLGEDDPYDLVVTDIAMPWMSGLQALQSTRYAGLTTPVIVMTGLRDAEIPARVRALGANAVLLHKPFGIRELERAIATLLPRKRGHEATA